MVDIATCCNQMAVLEWPSATPKKVSLSAKTHYPINPMMLGVDDTFLYLNECQLLINQFRLINLDPNSDNFLWNGTPPYYFRLVFMDPGLIESNDQFTNIHHLLVTLPLHPHHPINQQNSVGDPPKWWTTISETASTTLCRSQCIFHRKAYWAWVNLNTCYCVMIAANTLQTRSCSGGNLRSATSELSQHTHQR